MWILYVLIAIIALTIVVLTVYLLISINKNVGKKFLKDSEKEQKAPEFYYDKQKFLRTYYVVCMVIDYILLIISIVCSTIVIYMIMDITINLELKITISVLAAVSTTLRAIIKPDRIGHIYMKATRILENAIIEYEQGDKKKSLIEANKEAEALIENGYL